MARRVEPKFMGVLKTNDVGLEGWVVAVHVGEQGQRRLIAMKATQVAQSDDGKTRVMQQKLVDINGKNI